MVRAVADVLVYGPVDSSVPEGIGMPRWDWDGLVTSGDV